MIKHVALAHLHQLHLFLPRGVFAPLITAISISPEIMKSVTLIFFPLPACLNPVSLCLLFNPKFKEDWKLLKRHVTKKSWSASVSISSQAGCVEQDFYYDCGMYSHLQGNLTVCDCCEAFLLTKPVSCKHLIKSHSCPALTVALPKARRLLVRLCHESAPLWLCRWRRFLCLRQFDQVQLAEEPASIRVGDSLWCAMLTISQEL